MFHSPVRLLLLITFRIYEDMWKTQGGLGFLVYLYVQTILLKSIHGREFIRCPDLDDNLRAELPLVDLLLNSRLLCGAMCTEQGYNCLSYAWNRDSKRCILFFQRCSNATQRDQTEKSWEHYEIKGRVFKYYTLRI